MGATDKGQNNQRTAQNFRNVLNYYPKNWQPGVLRLTEAQQPSLRN
jgi:hypothetical protein